jgi:hypothetical protein
MAWAVWIERTFKDRFFAANDLFAAFAARFDPASGWSAAEKVTGDLRWPLEAKITTEGQGNPRVIVASNGGAIGVLQSTLYAARRSPTGTWAALETLAVAGPAGGLAPEYSEFDMAVDADDNAVAMWREYDGTRYLILTRHYTLVGGWEPTLGLQPSGPDSGFAPQLAMDDMGNGFVAWHQFDGVSYGIWTARFEKTKGWTALQIISSVPRTPFDQSTFPKIACDSAGNAVAIWLKYDFALNQSIVRANYYSKTAGWGSDETISSGSGISWRAEVAVSRTGYATAVWWQESTNPMVPNTFQPMSASRPPTP